MRVRLNIVSGWVEFLDKKIAKRVAMSLNSSQIGLRMHFIALTNSILGGKKSSYFHDDLWNMKYLSKFKWTNLTERIGMPLNSKL